MRSTGGTVAAIIITALVAGGAVYFYNKSKAASQESQLSYLQNKLAEVEKKSADETNKVDAPAGEQTASPEDAAQTQSTPAATTATNTTATTPAAIDTTKWKSFTSSSYSYSIKYPTDWVCYDATSGIPLSILGCRPKTAKDYIFYVSVEKSNLDYTIARIKKQYADGYTAAGQNDQVINGQTFKVLNFTSNADPKIQPKVSLVAKDDKVYYCTEGLSGDAAITGVTPAIVSSFQLAAATTPAATATKP